MSRHAFAGTGPDRAKMVEEGSDFGAASNQVIRGTPQDASRIFFDSVEFGSRAQTNATRNAPTIRPGLQELAARQEPHHE